MENKITRVWGVADNISLIFSKGDGDTWDVAVPPDFTDGQYACQIFAEDILGNIGMWTGILYLLRGIVCLHITSRRIDILNATAEITMRENGMPDIYENMPDILFGELGMPDILRLLSEPDIIFKGSCLCGRK